MRDHQQDVYITEKVILQVMLSLYPSHTIFYSSLYQSAGMTFLSFN